MTRTQVIDLLSKAKAAIEQEPKALTKMTEAYITGQTFFEQDLRKLHAIMLFKESASAEAITRLAESYLDAIEILRWYSDDDSHGCGEFIWKKTAYEADAGKRAREFLRKIGEI